MASERSGTVIGKIKLLLRQMSETMSIERLKNLARNNRMVMNKVENTPLEKRNKEEQIRKALQLKRDARLEKMKRT